MGAVEKKYEYGKILEMIVMFIIMCTSRYVVNIYPIPCAVQDGIR